MNEDRAAAAGHARPRVVIQFDEQIVEMVVAPKSVAGFRMCARERPVVTTVGGLLAPGVVPPNGANRQSRFGARQAIGPPPYPRQTKAAARRRSIAFTFVGADASTPERHRHRAAVESQDTAGAIRRSGGDADFSAIPPVTIGLHVSYR